MKSVSISELEIWTQIRQSNVQIKEVVDRRMVGCGRDEVSRRGGRKVVRCNEEIETKKKQVQIRKQRFISAPFGK